jgi:hypothetical protein
VRSELVIITPEVAPGCGGVADHTLAVLEQWGPEPNVTLLVGNRGAAAAESRPIIRQLGKTRQAISKQLPPESGKIFVQYSAYGYDRIGYPRELIRALIDWKTRTGGLLVIMFHEIWSFWPLTNKNFYVQQLHRLAVRRLLECCDAAFTTTASQAEYLHHLCNRIPVQVLCVGTNIRRRQSPVERQPDGAVLFGLQLNRIRTLECMQQSLAALAAAGHIKTIRCVGQDGNSELRTRERELLDELKLSSGFQQEGARSADEVSELLSSVSFGIFGQNELSCCKSGSFMAYAAHQLKVVAEFADPAKPPPVCWLVAPSELLGGIDESELKRRAESLRMWQEQNCSWDVIASRLAEALHIERRSAVTP